MTFLAGCRLGLRPAVGAGFTSSSSTFMETSFLTLTGFFRGDVREDGIEVAGVETEGEGRFRLRENGASSISRDGVERTESVSSLASGEMEADCARCGPLGAKSELAKKDWK